MLGQATAASGASCTEIRFGGCWNATLDGMPSLRPEEEWSRSVIAHALGRPVVQHDDGSLDGMHDLDILLGGSARAAVEVTAAADGQAIELWNLLNGVGRWIEPALVGGWMVTVNLSARAKRLRVQLPALLGALEQSGEAELRTRWDRHSAASTAARELGVASAHQLPTALPGRIYVTLELPIERTGGFVASNGDDLARWTGEFLRAERCRDVRDKLRRSGCEERHAFLILPGFALADFGVTDLLMRDGAPLPEVAPDLPAEVTHVWAMSTWATGGGMRWSSDGGWSHFDKRIAVAA